MLNKVIIITSYAIICVSRHRGYQDNTGSLSLSPHTRVATSFVDNIRHLEVTCGPAPGNQRRKGGTVIHYNCLILTFILKSL